MYQMFDAPIICNDQSLDRLLAADIPTLILFWNGPELSNSLNETMVEIAKEYGDRLIAAKINIADSPQAATQFEVGPSALLIGLRQGEIVSRVENPTSADLDSQVDVVTGNVAPESTDNTNGGVSPQLMAKKAQPNLETHPIHVTDGTFEKSVLKSDIPVLVDFWAPWCGPCHMIAPVLDKLARDFAGRLRVVKVNVDENPHYAGVYGIQGIPTLLVVRDGEVIERMVGALPEAYLRQKLDLLLRA